MIVSKCAFFVEGLRIFAGGTKDVLPDPAVVIVGICNKQKSNDDDHQIRSITGPCIDHCSSHVTLELERCTCLQPVDADLFDNDGYLGVEGNTALLDVGSG